MVNRAMPQRYPHNPHDRVPPDAVGAPLPDDLPRHGGSRYQSGHAAATTEGRLMVGKMIGPVGRPLALLAMLGLVGCGLAYTVPYYSPSYFPGEERVAGTVMPVIVRGNPFAIPQAEF